MTKNDLKTKILAEANDKNIKFINLQFTDILGMLKSVVIPISELETSLETGSWFDGSSVTGFTSIDESDMRLVPDLETFALLPWVSKENPTARLICDVFTSDNKPFEGCPRYILKRTLEKAKEDGFIYNTGPEMEFYIFKKDNGSVVSPNLYDGGNYFDSGPRDSALSLRREMVYALQQFNIRVEMSHHEVGPGQYEIDFKYNNALQTADNAITLKYAFKSISNMNDAHTSFMPKPITELPGSGMHVNQSLFNLKKENVFYDSRGTNNLSKTARSFLAGQLKYIDEITAVLNSTVNSYKRLVPGYEAGVYVCWGQRNRSALVRVPRVSKGQEKSTRIELRSPDPASNPYLAFSLMLAIGLKGIKEDLEPPEEVSTNVYKFTKEELKKNHIPILPESLKEALETFKKSKLAKDVLGSHAFTNYIKFKEKEWEEYKLHVTDWELSRYLEVL